MAEKGNILFDKLSQLKCPSIYKFNPSSFDWLFDNEEALPFLDWFCASVQMSNLLTDKELKKFDSLKKESITILEGKRLSEALDNQPVVITCTELETEIQDLQNLKDGLVSQKQLYINQLNIFNLKEKEINKKIADFDTQNANEEAIDDVLVTKLKYKDAMCTEALLSLNQTSTRVVEFLSEEKLLCQHSFKQYLTNEEECTTHLTNFASKQFDQNMGQMGQNSGLEMCAFLQIGNSDFERLLGLDEKARSFQNWELNRLQFQLPSAEEDRIANETQVSSLTAAIDSCHQIFSTILNGKFASSLVDTRDYINSLEQKNSIYARELSSLKNDVLNSTFKATQLRCSSIIVGDCSLKLLRQEFFISKQKEFLSLLVKQWAREQLVLLALRLEGRQLETLLTTQKNVSQHLQEVNKQLVDRLDTIQNFVDVEKSIQNRNTILRNDEISCSLKTILGLEFSTKNVPSNYEDLSNLSNILQKQFEAAKLNFSHLNKAAVIQQKNLKQLVSIMEELVFGVPLTSITQKLSNPKCIEESIATLDTSRGDVQCRLKPFYRDFKTKQVLFKNDHLVTLERRLWTLFYTDISSMIRKSEALEAKASTM